MRKTSKLKSKLCAWLLVCATVFTTLASSGASVLADNNDTETKQTKTQVSTLSVKSGEGGEISIELPDGQIETTSDGEELELELETGSTVEATVSLAEGYEVSTYRLTMDSGDEEDIDEYDSFSFEITEDTDLEATYTEEEAEKAPVVEEPEEVVTEETEENENEEAVSETPQPTNPTPSEEETTTEEPQSTDTVGKEDEIATSKADVTPMNDITKEVEKDSDIAKDSILDPVTEQYVLENANAEYTSADKIELANILIVKNSIVDGKYVNKSETLDDVMLSDDVEKKLITMLTGTVAVYNLSDNSNYLVAFANTMMNEKNTTVTDCIFAKNNNNGEVIDDCYYDSNTGLVYINKKWYTNEKNENILANLQVQFLQYQTQETEDIDNTIMSTTIVDDKVTDTSSTVEKAFSFETTIKTEKNLQKDEMLVTVNGLVMDEDSYSYNSEKGIITLEQASASVNSVTVTSKEETLISKLKKSMEPLTVKAVSKDQMIGTGLAWLKNPNIDVGYYELGKGYYQYSGGGAWFCSYVFRDLQKTTNTIAYGGSINYSQIETMQNEGIFPVDLTLSKSQFKGMTFTDFSGNGMMVRLQCAHVSNPIGDAGVTSVGGKPVMIDMSLRVVDKGIDTSGNEYFILGFLTKTTHTQAGIGFFKFYVRGRSGDLTLKKVSANTSLTSGNGNYSLAGAEYGVYSDAGCTQGVGTLTTRADGTSNTLKLKQGTYYVRENKAPTGYILDQTVRSITVTSGQTATLNVSDPPKTVEISLTKKSDNPEVTDNNQLYSLEGAEYSIYKDEACTQYVNKMVTDEDGLASIDGLALNIYYVKETKASPGYGLDTKVYKLDARSGSANVIEVSVESKEVALMDPVNILLQKVDAETGTAVPVDEGTLQDAQFEVKLYDTFMTTDPGDAGFEPVWSAVMRTDEDGHIFLLNSYVVSGDHVYTDSFGTPSLPYGTITFKEIKSPNGYLLNDEVIVVQNRDENGTVINAPQYTEPTQEEQPMTLKIIKVQNGTTLPIPEAEFEWVLPDGSNHTYSTDENGEVFFKGLEWGKHTITEVKVPDGYSVNKNKITFTVNQDNTITDASGATVTDTDGNFTLVIDEDNLNPTVTYENKPAPFDLHVYKINDVDFALEGAEFTIYTDEDCTDVWKVGKTDTNGDLTFEDLIVGKTYYMKETKAPQGYRIPINEDGSDIVYKIMVTSTPVKDQFTFYVNDKPYTTSSNGMFTVTGTKADRICNITVINERGKQLPETGSSMMLILLAAGIALMGGAVVASQTRKLSNKRR